MEETSAESMKEKMQIDEKRDKSISVDEALETTGCYGRFQFLAQIIFSSVVLCVGYQSVMSYFIADDPSWKCTSRNTTSAFCHENAGLNIKKDNVNFTQRCHFKRTEWSYSTDKKYSFTTEFDLICSKTSMAAFVSGIYHIGGMFGVPFAGLLADKYGRKIIILVCLTVNTVISISCCFVHNVIQLSVTRFLLGATGWSSYTIAFVYMGELVTPKYRSTAGNIIGLGLSMSYVIIDYAAYHLRLWRHLGFYASLPSLVLVLVLLPFPESPRWLLVNGATKKKAEHVIKQIGRFNRFSPGHSDISLTSAKLENETKNTYFDLFRNRNVAVTTLILGLIWMTAGISFYMIAFESSNLGGDMYKSFAYSTLTGMPSNLIAIYPMNRFGRQRFVLVSLVVTGLLAGSTTLIPNAYAFKYILKMAILSAANFSSFCIILGAFVWTFEIFPTSLRLQGWGICIALERIGAFTAPFLTTVLHQYNPRLPYICVFVLCILSTAGGFILPETNNKGTREDFSDFFDEKPKAKVLAYDNSIVETEGDVAVASITR